MLIYNTSFHISGERLVPKFLQYMHDEYIPRLKASPQLSNLRFVRLLTNIGDDMFAYSLMADVPHVIALKEWKRTVGDELEADFTAHFGEQVLLFNTTMRTVDL
jgi:hypothetical protein